MSDELRDDLPAAIDSLYDSGSNDEGNINIAENVFASIIQNYTLEIPEVIKFASGGVAGLMSKMIGKHSSSAPIQIDIDEQDQVEVTVNVILQFGSHVPTVAAKIQKTVNKKVEEMTGKSVARVNVNVVDLLHSVDEQQQEN